MRRKRDANGSKIGRGNNRKEPVKTHRRRKKNMKNVGSVASNKSKMTSIEDSPPRQEQENQLIVENVG